MTVRTSLALVCNGRPRHVGQCLCQCRHRKPRQVAGRFAGSPMKDCAVSCRQWPIDCRVRIRYPVQSLMHAAVVIPADEFSEYTPKMPFIPDQGSCFILHLIPQLMSKVHEIHEHALCWGEQMVNGPSVVQTADAWHQVERLARALVSHTSERSGDELRS